MMKRLLFPALVFFCMHGAGAEEIGRLFSTPDERVRLDRLRLSGGKTEAATEATPSVPATVIPEPVIDRITVDGFVKRGDGKNTTWINQMPRYGNDSTQGITVLQKMARPPLVSLRLQSGKQLNLKPGQTFDSTTDTVSEVYETPPPGSPAAESK